MGFKIEDNFNLNAPNHVQFIYAIRNAFMFKKEKIGRKLDVEFEKNSVMYEFALDSLNILDSTCDNFMLSYNQPYVSILNKEIVEQVLEEYLSDLENLQKTLGFEIPRNGTTKLLFEIEIVRKIIQMNERKKST